MKIKEFLTHKTPLLDVRSPCEYNHAHIPGAQSFPLFTDDERAQVGTLYKKEGKDAAVKLGLRLVGPKLANLVEEAEKLTIGSKTVRLYCARGGMRSGSLAWLLQTAGFECVTLFGGYKLFRRWVLEQFEKTYHLSILGGLTGCGKTAILQDLKQEGEQIIDLEAYSNHKGSSYGHLGQIVQPSAEQFENLLAVQLSQFDRTLPCWIEDENRTIGSCPIPKGLWVQMQKGLFFWIDRPKEQRIKHLLEEYGKHTPEELITATQKLEKRLGLTRTKQIIQAIRNHDLHTAIDNVLDYYDSAYLHSLKKNRSLTPLAATPEAEDACGSNFCTVFQSV